MTITQDGEYYALIKNPRVRDATVLWPERKKTFNNTDRGFLLELGDCERGETIHITSETRGEDMQVEVYRFNYAALRQIYEKLSPGGMETDAWEDRRIRGKVNVTEDMLYGGTDSGRLFFSIPYDRGWTVTVDGEPVETEKVFDAFLSVSVPFGEHVIELTYMPEGLMEGAAISLLSAVLLGLALMAERRRDRRDMEEKIEEL